VKDLKIAIVHENKFFNIRTKLILLQEDYKNVVAYEGFGDFEIGEYDIVILPIELFKACMLDLYKETIFVILADHVEDSDNLKVFYLNREFSDQELKQLIYTIALLKDYEKQIKKQNKELKKALEYIQEQEEIASVKQLKMIEDEISYSKIDKVVIDSIYMPKDKLSGDSYLAIRKNNKVFIILIDAMDKGIGASLTSTLINGIGNYILHKTDDISVLLDDYVKYIRQSLAKNETLCMLIFEMNLDTYEYKIANFGMPPLYVLKNNKLEKIRANNLPISTYTEIESNVDTYQCECQKMLLLSDGIIESRLKDEDGIYYFRFKDVFEKEFFLRDLIKDFKKHAIQDDDITAISFHKFPTDMKLLYERECYFKDVEDLDRVILEINDLIPESERQKQKIIFALQEILLNIYEHAYRDIDKQTLIIQGKKLTPIKGWAKITLKENENYYLINIADKGKGCNYTEILKMENKIDLDKFHGRGLVMLSNITSGVFFENNGRVVNIFIRRSK